jgi:tetratricopeptide (TPR) repeat protein
LAETRPNALLPDLATSLNNLGETLSDLGQREQVLAATQEAVDLNRHLAEARPDAFLPDLAMSLGAMSRALGALGHQAEAAQTANQALELLAPFVELYPERFGPLAHAIETDELRYTKTANQLPR